MASEAALAINKIPFPDEVSQVQERLCETFGRFSKHTATLCAISTKQKRGVALRPSESKFLKTVVEKIEHGSGLPSFTGWYFDLFYGETYDRGLSAIKPDNISAEVGTLIIIIIITATTTITTTIIILIILITSSSSLSSAQIQTAPADPAGTKHKGCVLYEGTGGVDFTLVAVDDGNGARSH